MIESEDHLLFLDKISISGFSENIELDCVPLYFYVSHPDLQCTKYHKIIKDKIIYIFFKYFFSLWAI